MKVVLGIIGVIFVIMLLGTMMGGIKSAQTDERTDSFVVATGGAETTGDVVLVADLYADNILEVTRITSTVNTDNPLADTYVSNTNTLTVRGLTADETRTLAVTYRYDALTGDSAPAGTFLGLTPIFVIIACVAIVVGGIVAAFAMKH